MYPIWEETGSIFLFLIISTSFGSLSQRSASYSIPGGENSVSCFGFTGESAILIYASWFFSTFLLYPLLKPILLSPLLFSSPILTLCPPSPPHFSLLLLPHFHISFLISFHSSLPKWFLIYFFLVYEDHIILSSCHHHHILGLSIIIQFSSNQ